MHLVFGLISGRKINHRHPILFLLRQCWPFDDISMSCLSGFIDVDRHNVETLRSSFSVLMGYKGFLSLSSSQHRSLQVEGFLHKIPPHEDCTGPTRTKPEPGSFFSRPHLTETETQVAEASASFPEGKSMHCPCCRPSNTCCGSGLPILKRRNHSCSISCVTYDATACLQSASITLAHTSILKLQLYT